MGPARRGGDTVEVVTAPCERLPIDIVRWTMDIAVVAAGLRARHRAVPMPDALVMATASMARADCLVTTDRRWPPPGELALPVPVERL